MYYKINSVKQCKLLSFAFLSMSRPWQKWHAELMFWMLNWFFYPPCVQQGFIVKRSINVASKPSLKIGTTNAICWNSLGLFRESWNFQHLFEKGFRETSQSFNSIRQQIENMEITIVWMSWMSWSFERFHEILFQTDAESFSFLSWKQKFYP